MDINAAKLCSHRHLARLIFFEFVNCGLFFNFTRFIGLYFIYIIDKQGLKAKINRSKRYKAKTHVRGAPRDANFCAQSPT